MSDNPEQNEEVQFSPAEALENIPGVGPKTAEKMVEKGFDTFQKVAEANPEDLAAAIPGLSVAKAEGVISETKLIIEHIEAGVLDVTGKPKKSKRKRSTEPEPERYDLPPADDIPESITRTSLKTGYEMDLEELGIAVPPKWLTRFERARIIGARALQISMGAPVLVDMNQAPKDIFALAEYELKLGVLPMTVRRSLPTGEYYDIPLSALLKNTRLD